MERNLELDTFIVEKIWGEPRPTHQIDPLWMWTGSKEGYSLMGQWIAHHDYEKGDITEWLPMPYSARTEFAMTAIDWLMSKTTSVERLLSFEIVTEYCLDPRGQPGHRTWIVSYRWDDKNSRRHSWAGDGDNLPLLICKAIKHYFDSVELYEKR